MLLGKFASSFSARLSALRAGASVARATRERGARLAEAARVAVESLEHRTLMTVVVPGATVGLPGTTAAAQPALAGVVVRDALIPIVVNNAAGQPVFRGTLQDRVVRENATGTLDFYQTVRANAGFNLAAFLETADRLNFGGYSTDANFRTDGLGSPGIRPELASRTLDGQHVLFRFNHDLVPPNASSLFYFVKTNATQFAVNAPTTLTFRHVNPALGGGTRTLITARPVGVPLQTGRVTGLKWNDLNGDGVRQAAEPPLANVRIYSDRNNNGVFNAGEPTSLTNAAGVYAFSAPAGLNRIREVVPAGFRQTAPASGVHTVAVPAGGVVAGLNFGNTRTVRITGTVFNDANGNGIRNVGEGGLSGFRVYDDANNNGVYNAGERNVVTGASGAYVLNGLPSGLHRVRVQPKLFYTQTAPAGGAHVLLMPSGAVATNRDFGMRFRPIIINPVPIPQPIPIPIPNPDPGPLARL